MSRASHGTEKIMAEIDPKEQPDSSASTPNSSSNVAARELKAAKDRSCPFCGQAFTSSSLGRHLDLYIKPKNPKPPDGVHDVHEIRKLRGSITRRQPRSNTKVEHDGSRRNSSGWSNDTPQKAAREDMTIADDSPVKSPIEAKDGMYINAPSWHATGVINDIPPRAPSRTHNSTPSAQAQRAQQMRNDLSGNRIERPDYATEDMWKLQEEAEVGRAAEMALREVLGSLEAANRKAHPAQLFEEFDFCSLSFPGLCLAMLPQPLSLFSSTPFAAAHTWSLSPPGEKQLHALNTAVNEHVTFTQKTKPEDLPDSCIFRLHVYLQGAYEHWQTLSEDEKALSWNLELCRAFAREKEKKHSLKAELETAQQRIAHLEAEFERLSRCQLPRDYLLHPPNTTPVSPAAMREVRSTVFRSGAAETNYDADALLNKWKSAVKSTSRPHKVAAASQHTHTYVEPRRNPLKGDMMLNGSVFGVNGPIPRDVDIGPTHMSEQPTVMYETPKNPGAVLGAEEGMEVYAEGEGGGEEGYGDARALMRTRGEGMLNEGLNVNGKRPLDAKGNGGRGSLKLYREQPKT